MIFNSASARDLRISDSEELTSLALECWKSAYRNIDDLQTVVSYVQSVYSNDGLVRSLDLVRVGLTKFTLLENSMGNIVGYILLKFRSPIRN